MTIVFQDSKNIEFQLAPDWASSDKSKLVSVTSIQEAESLLKGARLVKPLSWSAAWSEVFRSKVCPSTTDKILRALAAAIVDKKLQLTQVGESSTTAVVGHSRRTGGGGDSDAIATASEVVKPHQAPAEAADSFSEQNAKVHVEAAKVSPDAKEGSATVTETCTRGCPISMISGEELLSLTDFTLPGPLPFAWTRTYRTGHARDTGLGHGWTHSASERLYEHGNSVELNDSEGRTLRFKRPLPGQRSRLINEKMVIDALSTDAYVVRRQDEPHKVFTRLGQTGAFRLTQIQHPSVSDENLEQSFVLSLYYDPHNNLNRIVGNWGKALLLQRDTRGRITSIVLHDQASAQRKTLAEYDYSEEGDLVAHRDSAGRGETYAYTNHLFSKRTLTTGFSYYYEWDRQDTQARCTRTWGDNGVYDYRFIWDPDNNRSQATDSRGYTSTFCYNEFGLITEEIDNEGGIHRYTYENGLRTSYTDPEGNVTRYAYDSTNNLIGIIDALDQRQTRYFFQGKLVSSTDKDGALWRRSYNARGLIDAITAPDGQTTRFRYNVKGLLIQQLDSRERVTRYEWNENGELIALISPEGHKQAFKYNPWGQLLQVDVWLASRHHGGTTYYQYTDSGEIARIIYPGGEKIDIAYNANGQVERFSDRRGRVTRYEYDGLSQVIRKIDAEGNSIGYQYDTERNLTKLINENGEEFAFIYDGNERLIKEIGFDGRIQHYKYNQAGHLLKHLDAGEVVTEFERDALGRMLTKTSKALVAVDEAVEFNRYLYDPVGRLKETYNADQYLAFTYDRLGYLIKEHHSDLNDKRQRIDASMVDIHYQRHSTGQVKKIKLPDGQIIDYRYDHFDRLQQVLFNGDSITAIERNAFGMEVNRQQGELNTFSDYDPMGRLIKQQVAHRQQKSGVINREYQYNAFGNLSSFKDGNWEVRYVYDMVDRLKRTEGDLNEHFIFDPAGNLLAQQKSDTRKSANGNLLRLQGDRKFNYDARGNLIREQRGKGGKLETTFEYNLQNQLIKVVKDNQVSEYKYDPLGRRIEKRDAFGATHYLWAGDQLIQESRHALKKTYVYEPETFKPVAMVQDGAIYHYHLDHLGTPRELTNQDGKVVWKARYKTYGNLAVKEVEDVENNLRFQGQYFDEESGLHYNRHRYYNPSTGQFISQDPIGLLGGVNNYQYAPNPTGWVDPFGLSCKEITLADIRFKSIWGGDGIEFYVRDQRGDKLNLGLAEISDDKTSITFGIFNDDNKDVTLKPMGFSLTEALLSISILEVMKQNNGSPPINLPGSLAKANKYNYQKEYALCLSEGLAEGPAMDRAIKNISFGKHRQNVGYEDIEVFHSSDMTAVTHDARGQLLDTPLENVPNGVGVRNAKLTNRVKLDQTLAKYEEVYKSGRE